MLWRASGAQPDKQALQDWWTQIDDWRARKSLAYQQLEGRRSCRNTRSSGCTS